MSRGEVVIPEGVRDLFRARLKEIQLGSFAREWEMERLLGYPVFKKLRAQALAHPINAAERKMWEMEE